MSKVDDTKTYEPPKGAIPYSLECKHVCRKCKEKTALCFECWHGHQMDVDYFCTSCGHSWGVDGGDS